MRKLIGNEVEVFFKKENMSDQLSGDLYGLLIDVSEDSLYVQKMDQSRIFVIPRENIGFCTTPNFPSVIDDVGPEYQPPLPLQPIRTITEAVPDPIKQLELEDIDRRLNVYVNDTHIVSIPIPPTFKIDKWDEKILRVIMGNPEVKTELAGKIQKEIKYSPGEVYISVGQVTPPSQLPEQIELENSFSIGGSPMAEYVNPLQMVTRLKNVCGGGKKDGDTNM